MKKIGMVLDLDGIRQRAERLRANSRTSQNQDEVKYKCSKCKDEEGILTRNEAGYEVWRDCECKAIRQVERAIQASKITPEFRQKTFANFDLSQVSPFVRDAYAVAHEYAQEFDSIRKARRNSVALLGRPGSGKTHLLMAVANTLLQRGIRLVYFPWVEGFNSLKTDFAELESKIRVLQTVPVLYIDDACKGRVTPTDFQREQLFAIVNYRYLNNLPIMVSAERDFNQICAIDEAMGSRLREMCKGHTATITGGIELNYRLREG